MWRGKHRIYLWQVLILAANSCSVLKRLLIRKKKKISIFFYLIFPAEEKKGNQWKLTTNKFTFS